jgi:predicted DNA-binding transcriptional regulator YafY
MSVVLASVLGVNRTDRLYAIVEDLRSIAPRRRSARELAARYEVSMRTIERDISALQQADVPIYADVGRHGGYALDKSMSLPPLNFTPAEAVAVAVALSRADSTPFASAANGAIRKIVTAMSARDAAAARDLANRVRLFDRPDEEPRSVPSVIQDAIVARQVLRLTYADKDGTHTEREVEPVLFMTGPGRHWYLIAWCRLRQAERAFRIDRIVQAETTREPAPPHAYEDFANCIPDLIPRSPLLDA